MKTILKYNIFLLLSVICMVAASCSQKTTVQQTRKEAIIYPTPPDTARIQYLTSISNSENASKKRSRFSKFILGETEARPIKKPYGVAFHNGKIYICDTGSGCIEIIDLNKNTFEYFEPKGLGKFQQPLNCFVDDDGKLFVSDVLRKQIVIFDRDGNYTGSFGDKTRFKPTDVFVTENKIWVVNLDRNCIQVYGKDSLQLLYSFPDSAAVNETHLFSPTNLTVNNDTVYVSDMGDFKIKLFTAGGKYLKSVGSLGTRIGQLVRPKGIAVDRESNLYVVDAGIENTQIFNRDGKLLMFFGGTYKGPGDMWLPAKVVIDYDNIRYFRKYVDPAYDLKYLVLVTNQYGPDKLSIYGRIDPKTGKQK